jgi:hypothetical protein
MQPLAVLVAVVTLGACEQGSSKVTDADCGKAVDALSKRAAPDKQAAAKTGLIKACLDGHWTREAVTCLTKAADKEAETACRYHSFTQEQAEKLDDVARELLSNVGAALAKMSEFKDQMCACKDALCTKHVNDAMTTWAQEVPTDVEPPRMTDAQQKRAEEIGRAMGECMQKATETGGEGATAAFERMASFKDQMCACKDADCAKRVNDDMMAWSKTAAAQIGPANMTEADQKRATELGTLMGECMQAAQNATLQKYGDPRAPKK